MLASTPSYLLVPAAAAAFAVGAVPFAWLIVRLLKGVDVRSVGSGNVGATNACRAFDGKGARIAVFLLVYVLDAAKGFVGASLGGWIVGDGSVAPTVCAAAAILGHVFTPVLGWRGGKGVATASGALLRLDWRVTLIALGAFFLVRFPTGHVFFGSLALGLGLFVGAVALEPSEAFGARLPLTLLCLGIALFLVWTHRSNLQKFFSARQA